MRVNLLFLLAASAAGFGTLPAIADDIDVWGANRTTSPDHRQLRRRGQRRRRHRKHAPMPARLEELERLLTAADAELEAAGRSPGVVTEELERMKEKQEGISWEYRRRRDWVKWSKQGKWVKFKWSDVPTARADAPSHLLDLLQDGNLTDEPTLVAKANPVTNLFEKPPMTTTALRSSSV